MSVFLDEKWGIFLKVAELGSFTRVANLLGTPQSNISRQIALLEKGLGVRLFHRTGRGVILTEAGEALIPRLTEIAKGCDILADDIATAGRVPTGEVAVGLLPWTAPVIADDLFRAAQKELPRVKIHLCEGSGAQLQELLNEGRIDIAMQIREGRDETDHVNELASFHLRLIGLTGSPLVIKPTVRFLDLAGVPLVVPSGSHPLRLRLSRLERKMQITLNYAYEADSVRLQEIVAAAGGGYAITTGLIPERANGELAEAEIVEPRLLRTIVLGRSTRRPETLATRAVDRLIKSRAPMIFSPLGKGISETDI